MDWGTVPAWLSAVLTGGSLTLGFYIILRDHKKQEEADARNVVCWDEYENKFRNVFILNKSARPIYGVSVFVRIPGPEDGLEEFGSTAALRPDEETSVQVPRGDKGARWVPWCVGFTDSDGQHWMRDIETGKTYRRKRVWTPLHNGGRIESFKTLRRRRKVIQNR
ncbi:hypothetical protein [Streptomyces griseorubiginosus]|uniref:hypothetical protein n=1 Tax=Streptomyces griseorubiginosus TaxID=67304 RepID=UPI000AC4D0F6|nr:hypothetical protein [Streptomyces griseorubiginosus]